MKSGLTMAMMLVGATALAGEVKVAEKDVPIAALDAVAKKYPKARRVGFEKESEGGKVAYEVKLVDGTRSIDVDVSPEGKITAEEEVIAISDVPPAVREALARSKYGSWTAKKAERVIKDEKLDAPRYEIQVTNDKSRAEIVFAKDGKIVSTEGAGRE